MAVTSTFNSGQLSVIGDALDNNVTVSRDAAGTILVNGGAVATVGGTPTVANTSRIQAFGLAGNDVLTLSEINGALPAANLFGGGWQRRADRRLRRRISSLAKRAMTRCWAGADSICCSAARATTR